MKKRDYLKVGRWMTILLFAVLFLAFSGCKAGSTTEAQTGSAEEASDGTAPEKEASEYQIYYNFSAEHSEDGMTKREIDKTDGYYHVLVAGDGREVELRVEKKRLVSEIDRQKVFAVKLDDKRIVEEVKTIDEIAGGYLYFNVYVTEVEGRHFKLNMSSTGRGFAMEMDLPENVPVFNVSDYAEVRGVRETKYYPSDKISVVQNKDGSIHSVYIVERVPGIEANHVHCLCTDECRELIPDHVCEELRFAPWNDPKKMPTETGYYFLNCDMELSGQSTTSEGANVVICLNGHKVQGMMSRRVFSVFKDESSLTITDCQEKQGFVKGVGDTDQGSMIWVAHGSCTVYGGFFDASDMFTRDHDGACIALQPNTEFTMYGGTFLGGKTAPHHFGGSVFVSGNSVFRMYGGTIRDGRTPDSSGGNVMVRSGAKCYLYGGTIQGGQAATGGNVCVLPNGYLEIHENARIIGGIASSYVTESGSNSGGHGGNVSCSGEIVMNGGIISGGRTDEIGSGGGNVSILSNSGKFTMNGGTISGGSGNAGGGMLLFYAPNGGEGPLVTVNGGLISGNEARTGTGGNICVSSGTVRLTDGTISNGEALSASGGNVSVAKTGSFLMSGGLVFGGLAMDGGNLRVDGKAEISGGEVRDGAGEFGTTYESANVQVMNDEAEFILSGGVIAGGVLVAKGRIVFRDSAKIEEASYGFSSYDSVPRQNIVFDALTEGAMIHVTANAGAFGTATEAFTLDMLSKIRILPSDSGRTPALSGRQLVAH